MDQSLFQISILQLFILATTIVTVSKIKDRLLPNLDLKSLEENKKS